ncbi:hypothetical protein [Streptomyces sp. NPDC007905]|uniref:hypothetical protein n=1 Tax=Streptomyces sp. NPDC007905 TaxID=3364788 RepID=UPI0036E64C4D
MEWATLVGTALGALTTLAGSSWSEHLRARRDRQTRDESQRQEAHVAFVLACNASHEQLRRIARGDASDTERRDACRDALLEAGLFAQRERLLITASPDVVCTAEVAQRSLLTIRDLIGSGGTTETENYREAYARYASALWQLRQAMRKDTVATPLNLEDPVLIREQLPPANRDD